MEAGELIVLINSSDDQTDDDPKEDNEDGGYEYEPPVDGEGWLITRVETIRNTILMKRGIDTSSIVASPV